MSAKASLLPLGIYRHYKGSLYQVIGLAHDANTEESFYANDGGQRLVVVYISLQLDPDHLGTRMAVRSFDDFIQRLCATTTCKYYGHMYDALSEAGGCGGCDELAVPRFKYVGVMLTKEIMLLNKETP